MTLSDCEPGEWYLAVNCKKCKTKQPLFHDLSKGKAKIERAYKHRCDNCQHKGRYAPEEIERYQHPAK